MNICLCKRLCDQFAGASGELGRFPKQAALGGVESLITHPVTMTHGSIPKDVRDARGVTDSLLRLSVGIEDARDLIDDLTQALDATA